MRVSKGLLLSFILTSFFCGFPAQVMATTFTVNTNVDELEDSDNTCTLREALTNANLDNFTYEECGPQGGSGTDTIEFELPDGQEQITLSTQPLTITKPVIIDGLSQEGASCSDPVVTLVKGAASYAFYVAYTSPIQTEDLVIKGFRIKNFTNNTNQAIRFLTNTYSADSSIMCNTFDNNFSGIFLTGTHFTSRHSFIDNRFLNVGSMALDLASGANSGPTANDDDDDDNGVNSLLNYPVITNAQLNGTTATIVFDLDVDAANTPEFRVDFYSAGIPVGNAAVITDNAPGSTAHTVNINNVTSIDDLKATSTESFGGASFGATSEMSPVYSGNQPPHLDSFTSTTDDGAYGPADEIDVRAVYNQILSSGTIDVVMNTGATVTLTVVSQTNEAVGTYTVCSPTGCGENAAMLSVASIVSENITGAGGTQESSEVPNDNFNGKNIKIDTIAPNLLSFSSTTNSGDYGAAYANINVTATFDDDLQTGSSMTVALSSEKVLTLDQVGTGLNSKKLTGSYTVCSPTGCNENTPAGEFLNVDEIQSANVLDAAGNAATAPDMPAVNIAPAKQISIDTTAPQAQFGTSFIDGNILTLQYDELLDAASVPLSVAVYKMKVNANPDVNPQFININSANKTQVILTFVDAIGQGDAVQLKYDKPASFEIEDDSIGAGGEGNDAASFGYTAIIVVDNGAPELKRFKSSTEDNDYTVGAEIAVTAEYDENLAGGSFIEVELNNGRNVVLNVVSGKEISGSFLVEVSDLETPDLTVAEILEESVTDLAAPPHTQDSSEIPPSCDIPDNEGNLDCFAQIGIDLTAPQYVDGTAFNYLVTLNYNETLNDASVPDALDYTVTKNGSPVNVSGVSVSGMNVVLTVNEAIITNDIIHVVYTPGSNKLEDDALPDGNDAGLLDTEITADPPYEDGIVVNSTASTVANDGLCTLKEAINNANGNDGYADPLPEECAKGTPGVPVGANTLDNIYFNIPGDGPHTIVIPASGWPSISQKVNIDATTQPQMNCESGQLMVELNGAAMSPGTAVLYFSTPSTAGSTVKGLAINRGQTAIKILNDDVSVACNNLGTNPSGTAALGNKVGVYVSGENNIIGGQSPSQRNIISGNTDFGIEIGSTAHNNIIHGNLIGTDVSGSILIPNTIAGVRVFSSASKRNLIGGIEAGSSNVIAGNGTGVAVVFANTMASIVGNIFFDNDQLGIDLGPAGVTSGIPGHQDFPEIISLEAVNSDLAVEFMLDPTQTTDMFRIEFFANPDGLDPTGHGEGQIFLAAADVTVSAGQPVTVVVPNAAQYLESGVVTTATAVEATGLGATSEFSAPSSRLDFGDAPDASLGTGPGNYQTKAIDLGASHIVSSYYLGQCVDRDLGDLQNIDATADDLNAGDFIQGTCAAPGDDEDGIHFIIGSGNGKPSIVRTTASKVGYLNGWIDYNKDGDWLDVGERIITNKLLPANQQTDLSFYVPNNIPYAKRYARFRFASVPGAGPVGFGGAGEVEDYTVAVGQAISSPDEPGPLPGDSLTGGGTELQRWSPAGGSSEGTKEDTRR